MVVQTRRVVKNGYGSTAWARKRRAAKKKDTSKYTSSGQRRDISGATSSAIESQKAQQTSQAQQQAQQQAQAKTEAAFERDVQALTENYTKDLSARDLERLRVKYDLTSSQVREVGIAGSQIEKGQTVDSPQNFEKRVQEALKDGLTAREVDTLAKDFNLTPQETRELARYGAEAEKQALSPFREDVFGRIQALPQTFAQPVGRTAGFTQTEVGITQPQQTAAERTKRRFRSTISRIGTSIRRRVDPLAAQVGKIAVKVAPTIEQRRLTQQYKTFSQEAIKQYAKPLGAKATRTREKLVEVARDIGELQLQSPSERLVAGVQSFKPITETGTPRRVSTARTVDEVTQPIAQRGFAALGTFASAPFTTIEQAGRLVTTPFGIGAPFPTRFELTPEAQSLRTTFGSELREIQQKDLYPKPIAEFTEAVLPKTRGEVAVFGGLVAIGAGVSAIGRGAGLLGKQALRSVSGKTFGAAFKAGTALQTKGAIGTKAFRVGTAIKRAATGAQTLTLTEVPRTTQLALEAGFVGIQAYRIGRAPQEQRIQQAAQVTQEFAALGLGSRLLQTTPIGQRLTRAERLEGFRFEELAKDPSVAFFPQAAATTKGFVPQTARELGGAAIYSMPAAAKKPVKDIKDIAVQGVNQKTALKVQQFGKEYDVVFGGRLGSKTYGTKDQIVDPKTFTSAGSKIINKKEFYGSVSLYDKPSITSDYDIGVPSLYRRTVGGIKKYGLRKGLTGFRKDFDLLQKQAPFDVKGVYKVSDIKLFSPEKGLRTFVFGPQDFTGASFGAKAALQRTPSGNLVPDLRTQALKGLEGTYNYVPVGTADGGLKFNPYRRPKDFEQVRSILEVANKPLAKPKITRALNYFEKATVTNTKQILTDPIQARTVRFKLGELGAGFRGQTFPRVRQPTPTASKVTAPRNPQDTIPKINPKYFSPLRRSAFSRRTNPYSDRRQQSAWNVPSISKYSLGRVSPPSLKPRSSSSIFSTSLKFSGKPSVSPSPSKQQSFSVSKSASRSRSVSPSFSPSPSPSPSLSPSLSPSISPSVSPSVSPSPSLSYGFSPSPSRSPSRSLYYTYRRPPRIRAPQFDFPAGTRTGFAFAVPTFEQARRYAPTLRAVFGGIRAKRGKTKRLTGLEERPILI